MDRVGGEPEPGGAPANVAAGLARLGTPAAFAGAIAADAAGNQVADALRNAGVDLAHVAWFDPPAAVTRIVVVERTSDGDRRFDGFVPEGARFADTCYDVATAERAIDAAAMLVIGSLGLAVEPTAGALRAAVRRAATRGIPVVLDVNLRDVFWTHPADSDDAIRSALVPYATTVKAAREEAVRLFGTDDPQMVAARTGIAEVLVTDGPRGCRWSIRGENGALPAFVVADVDATGAGDAFLAGYLHARSKGSSPRAAVRFGSAAGAIVAGARGAMAPQPRAAAVDAFLAERPDYASSE